jgi:hypothetical protein
MGSAGEVPVADRGVQRYGDAIEGESPPRGFNRGDDLLAAPAQAPVYRGRVSDADVHDTVVERVGYDIDELVFDFGTTAHA